MARARNLKPSLFKNELLGVADPFLTILFESLWCLADRAGRLEDRPLRIKAETFPYREGVDVNVYLTELHRLGFICRYVVDGVALIQVLEFAKHQNPHKTEKASVLPENVYKSEGCPITVKAPLNNGVRPADSLLPPTDSLLLTPDSGFPCTDSGIQIQKPIVEHNPLDDVRTIFAYWQKIMKSPGSKLDAKRQAAILKAMKSYSPADICKAIRGCSKTPHNMGENKAKTKYNAIGLILRDADHIDRFILNDAGQARAVEESIEETNRRVMGELLGDSERAGDVIDMEPS